MNYIKRTREKDVEEYLRFYPAVAILGPRQCGKSTIARRIFKQYKDSIYLDLESTADRAKLTNPERFFTYNQNKLICLDEIQRMPDIFSVLRGLIDKHRVPGRFLILGSASRDLIRQSSETLAGRIGYIELTPFLYNELPGKKNIENYWVHGGFPLSFLANEKFSMIWRHDFIRSFLERDIPQIGFTIPAQNIQRLWQMLAHHHAQLLNMSQIGMSLGVSHTTVRSYISLLSQTFMVRELKPFLANTGKRLVKTPKVYLRDTGILNALLGIDDYNHLLGHPVYGYSWEGLVLENVCQYLHDWEPFFYRTSNGYEIDIILEKGKERIAIECKTSDNPTPEKGFWQAIKELKPTQSFIITPDADFYPIDKNVWVCGLNQFFKQAQGSILIEH